jgi:hypothetical protein
MANPLILQLTEAGAAAVQGESGSDQMVISQLGLTATPFDAAPTITALPGEFKRLPVTSGVAAAPNIAHVTVYDTSADVWTATGFGLFASDGTLIATYSQADPVLFKASLAFALLAFDIRFAGDFGASIDFGNAIFTWPPATETTRGVAKLATQDRVNAADDAGDDAETIVTPKTLRARLASILSAIVDLGTAISAVASRSITGGGLVTGGGDLGADRNLTVTAASAAELQAALATDKAVTPAAFGGLPRQRGAIGYEVFPGGTLVQRGLARSSYNGQQAVTITFPIAFANTDYDLQLTPVIPGGGDYDNFFQEIVGTRSTTQVQLWIQDPSSGGDGALSGVNWRAEGIA